MRKGSARTALMALAMLATGTAGSAAPASDAERWRAMAEADLEAVRARIIEAHPGIIDTANPGFNIWVEEGYEQARAHLPHVVSYDTAMAAVRYYTTGFEDGHLVYSDDIRKDFPILVTGWSIAWRNGRYEVVAALPAWSVPQPPVGAIWTGCDRMSAEDVLRTKVAPFVDRRDGDESRNRRAKMLWLRRPVADNLRECTFRTPAGASLKRAVVYQPITTEQFLDAMPRIHDGGMRAANAFDVRDGVLWVRAGNFSLRNGSQDLNALETMLADLEKVHDVRAIVFDVRGNRGGDSGIGDRIFEAATGGLEFDRTGMDSLPRYYAQWRVSEYLIRYLDSVIDENARLYGADSARVIEEVTFRDKIVAAKASGQLWVEQDAGRTITQDAVVARHGRLRRFEAKVALLTDNRCVSACLDFADIVLRVPDAVHAGQATGADSVYMVGSPSTMPSGNRLAMPVKVWRNRARGNNEALVPDMPVDLTADEATIREAVRRALGLK